jgi:hypothetical protein
MAKQRDILFNKISCGHTAHYTCYGSILGRTGNMLGTIRPHPTRIKASVAMRSINTMAQKCHFRFVFFVSDTLCHTLPHLISNSFRSSKTSVSGQVTECSNSNMQQKKSVLIGKDLAQLSH